MSVDDPGMSTPKQGYFKWSTSGTSTTKDEIQKIVDGLRNGYAFTKPKTQADIQREQLDNWFTYHAPVGDQISRYARIREAGLALAQVIVELTPRGDDQSAAIRKIREAIYTANAAIACGGK